MSIHKAEETRDILPLVNIRSSALPILYVYTQAVAKSSKIVVVDKPITAKKGYVLGFSFGLVVISNDVTDSNQISIFSSLFDIPENSKAALLEYFLLSGLTSFTYKVGQRNFDERDLKDGLRVKDKKMTVTDTISCFGIYSFMNEAIEKIIIPSADTDNSLSLILFYPFGKIRQVSCTVQDYQEITTINDTSIKVQWVFHCSLLQSFSY